MFPSCHKSWAKERFRLSEASVLTILHSLVSIDCFCLFIINSSGNISQCWTHLACPFPVWDPGNTGRVPPPYQRLLWVGSLMRWLLYIVYLLLGVIWDECDRYSSCATPGCVSSIVINSEKVGNVPASGYGRAPRFVAIWKPTRIP